MKNMVKFWGIIAFAAVIVFSMIGCSEDDNGDKGNDPVNSGTSSNLTINGLSGSGSYAVYIFTSGTDISKYQAITNAYSSGSYQAVGTSSKANSFNLIGWNGTSTTTAWKGSGNLPVLLLNSGGSVTETGNPMYSYATVNFKNGSGTVNINSFTAVVMESGSDPIIPGTGSKLTINGLPSGTFAVYVFTSGTDVSTYDAITNAYISGSYQAVGATVTSGNSFNLIGWNGTTATTAWTGWGNMSVLLLNSGGSVTDTGNPMYSYATVNFSNGSGTANISNFTAVVMGGGGDPIVPGTGSKLTVNGLPSGTYAVYVFTSGTDVSTYDAITNAYISGSYQAVGATVTSGNSFNLIGWNGTTATTAWTGSGNLPVLLFKATGSVTDTGNPMYSYATVNFSNGNGTAYISNFTAVVMGSGGGDPVFMEMVSIPAGTLTWGSATITLSAFKMGKYEVTQEQYEAVMGVNPSSFSSNPAAGEVQGIRPVEQVTWYDAVEFCNKLSEKEGLTPVYTITGRSPVTGYPITSATVTANWNNNGYRLPTEAEWEYACRAGSTTYWYFGDNESELRNNAWYNENANSMTHEVGKKTANAWGVYDMHGNVWEWCWDLYASLPSTNQTNYKGAVYGSNRVRRGGSWSYYDSAEYSSSSFRTDGMTGGFVDSIGFRIARSGGDPINPGDGTENTLSINYANGGGTGNAPSSPLSAIYGTSVIMPANTYTRTGYTFNGWTVSGSGSKAGTYAAGESAAVADLSSAIATGNASITLTATWTINTLSINYANGGGTGNAPSSPVSAVYGTSVIMPANTYTRTGYTFSGWTVSGSDSKAGTYAAGASVAVTDLSSAIATGNTSITLTATWTINTYTVKFNTNGGSNIASQSVNHGAAATRPNNPTKNDYGFIGWYSDAGLTTVYNFTTQLSGAITLYAKWGTLAATAQDIEDFGSGAGIADIFNVSSLTEWNNARDIINNNGDGKNYILNITGNFAIPGTTSNSFTSLQIVISIRGNYIMSLSSNGNILRIASNQKIIIRDLTLKGRTNGVDGANENNNNSLITNSGSLDLKGTSSITGNTYYYYQSGGGGVNNNGGTLTMWDNSSISGNAVRAYAMEFDTFCCAQGGGIFNSGSGSVILRGDVSIKNNTANATKASNNVIIQANNLLGQGGGIYNSTRGIVRIENGTISGNSANTGSQLYAWRENRDGMGQGLNGTEQFGTYDFNNNWTSNGNLGDNVSTGITIINGVRQ